jgi:hypothetical protein
MSFAQLPAVAGVPDWVSFLLLLAALGFGLAFLLMPFAVFGLKSRLEAVEQRLTDLDESLRVLARLLASPALARAADVEDAPIAVARPRSRVSEPLRANAAPIPPPPVVPADRPEPTIEWPRRG